MSAVIASVLYPQSDLIARQYAEGLAAVGRSEPGRIRILLVAEPGTDPERFLPGDRSDLDIHTPFVPATVTRVGLRQIMLDEATNLSGDLVVFADCDDIVDPGALLHFRAALADADIAFGDLRLIDANGAEMGKALFDAWNVPNRIEHVDEIRWRNFFGLSNTAVKHTYLRQNRVELKEPLIAIDWFLFHNLLALGARAQKVNGVVGSYRQYAANTLGAGRASNLDDLSRLTDITRQHLLALGGEEQFKTDLELLQTLKRGIETTPTTVQAILDGLEDVSGWYDDLFQTATEYKKRAARRN